VARVAGLRPEEREGFGGVDRANARAQVEGPRAAPGLRPQASPVSTYSRPAQPEGSGELEQLAKALAQLNPAMDRFAAATMQENREEQEARAARKIGGMTFEEAQEKMKSGEITEMQNPWFKAGFMKQFALRAGLRVSETTKSEYDTGFDKDNGDIEQFIAERAKKVLDIYGDDRHFVSGFQQSFGQFANKLRAEHAQYKSGRVQSEVRQGVYEIGSGIIKQGIEAGLPADQIVENVRAGYAGNKALLGVPYPEQDAEVFRMAQTFAQGISTSANPKLQKEIVEKLLTADRTAPDGMKLGKLADNREFAGKATQLLDLADKELRQRNQRDAFDKIASYHEQAATGNLDYEALVADHKKNEGMFTDSFVVSLKAKNDEVIRKAREETAKREERLRVQAMSAQQDHEQLTEAATLAVDGKLWAVGDKQVLQPNGEYKTISADKRREAVVDHFLRRSAQAAQERGETPEQTIQREAAWFGANGEKNPKWEELLKRGYIAGNAVNLSGSKPPESLAAAQELYERLYAQNPQLLRKHIDESAMDFYEAVRIGKMAGFDAKTAMLNAQEVNKDPTKFESQAWKTKFEDAAKIVQSQSGWFSSVQNENEIIGQVQKLASYYTKLGASPALAAEQAQARVKANYVNINDYLVRTGDARIPAAFPSMAKDYIADYVAKYGEKEGIEASDLTLQPVGNAAGHWRIVHKNSPGLIVDGAEGIVTMKQLFEAQQKRIEEARPGAVKRANDFQSGVREMFGPQSASPF
jgi:hypothetical protein